VCISTGTLLWAMAIASAEPDDPRGASDTEGSVKDTEQIIDIEQITKAVKDSTEPLYKSLQETRLKERFEKVKSLLQVGDVEREELLGALKDLRSGIDSFTGQWESIVDPLWEGQEALAKAVEQIRMKIPTDGDGEMPEKVRKLLESYDGRLTDLADQIKSTRDPVRKKRLEKVFANVLSLRRFTERLGKAGIHRMKVKLMLRTVQILSRLQDQLLDATFELEKVRSILASESDFLADYVDLLKMAKTADQLLTILRNMREGGTGLGGIPAKVGDVRNLTDETTKGLTEASNSVLDDLEAEIDQMAGEMEDEASKTADNDFDLQAEIERYSTAKVQVGKPTIVIE
jgi:hypothetical protein